MPPFQAPAPPGWIGRVEQLRRLGLRLDVSPHVLVTHRADSLPAEGSAVIYSGPRYRPPIGSVGQTAG